jgi:hypothetical protein
MPKRGVGTESELKEIYSYYITSEMRLILDDMLVCLNRKFRGTINKTDMSAFLLLINYDNGFHLDETLELSLSLFS